MLRDGDLHRAGVVFAAVCALRDPGRFWPMDARKFALAVDKLRDENGYASKFTVYNSVIGRLCPDFADMLRSALFSATISYVSPSFNEFVCNLNARGAREFLRRYEVSDEERAEIEAVLDEYLRPE